MLDGCLLICGHELHLLWYFQQLYPFKTNLCIMSSFSHLHYPMQLLRSQICLTPRTLSPMEHSKAHRCLACKKTNQPRSKVHLCHHWHFVRLTQRKWTTGTPYQHQYTVLFEIRFTWTSTSYTLTNSLPNPNLK